MQVFFEVLINVRELRGVNKYLRQSLESLNCHVSSGLQAHNIAPHSVLGMLKHCLCVEIIALNKQKQQGDPAHLQLTDLIEKNQSDEYKATICSQNPEDP